jgi:hypothetical protein
MVSANRQAEARRSRMPLQHACLFAALLLISGLTGCVTLKDPEVSQEQSRVVIGTLEGGHTLAQSFVSRRSRLNGVWLWMNVIQGRETGEAKLILQMFRAPGESLPLATVTRPLRSLPDSNPIQFDLPVQADPPGQAYYLTLLATSGKVEVFGLDEDTYPSGTAYLDKTPLRGDIAFRTSYDYDFSALAGDTLAFFGDIWLVFPFVAVLFLPGWLVWSRLSDQSQVRRIDNGEKLAIAVGLSMATIPVLMLWTTTAHLPWNRTALLLGTGLLVAFSVWDLWRKRSRLQRPDWEDLGLLVVFIAALVVRLIMVRDLAGPAWVDSVHHGMITRLVLEHGGFPDDYTPYLDITSTRYHPGFHSLLASLQWLSGLESLQAMLVFGQVLNALSVVVVYFFTKQLTGDSLASLIAALITGFFTPMPAYYTSWGRYTQLAGMLILPVAFMLVRAVSSAWVRRDNPWKTLLLAAIACAGLFLAHYRVAVFLACLLLADFFVRVLEQTLKVFKTFRVSLWLRETDGDLLREIAAIAIVTIASLILLMPWMPSMLNTMLIPRAVSSVKTSVPFFSDFAWTFLTTAWGKNSLYLAGLGVIWGIVRKPRLVLTLVLWVAILFVLANTAAIGWFPGVINNTSVEISLFMPISTLGGYFISQILQLAARWFPVRFIRLFASIMIAIGLVVSFMAVRQLIPILNPITFLIRQADKPALAWIDEHVPVNETILINPFYWGYGLYAGNDGGFWITPLTGRKTLPPPVLYGLDVNSQKVKEINLLSQEVMDRGQDADALHALLLKQGIQYIYIGGRGGVLSVNVLEKSPHFVQLYRSESTRVFQVK